ncbi:MAG: hypothetical protein QOH84_5644 [Kribbellaceae bacterium]|nr:hypothetical protein [Kribbellaceae bacterium]
MTSHDLKDLLQTMAANGTDRVPLDEQTLIPRIRSRRRRRTGLAAAVAASTAVVVAAGAYAVLPGGEQTPVAAPPQPTITLKPGPAPSPLACGSTATASVTGDPSLKLDVTQLEVVRDASGRAPLDIQLTNTTDKALDLFGTRYGPAITLVKDGVVVSTSSMETDAGKNWRYEAGQKVTQKVFIDTDRCGVPNSTKQLEPGTYQAYATKSFTQKTDVDPAKVVVAGGPWTIELK